MREKIRTFTAKMFKVDGQSFSEDTENLPQGIENHCILFLKVVAVITVIMLIFGDSRYIEGDVPLMWRILYEWKHLFSDILFHLGPSSSA